MKRKRAIRNGRQNTTQKTKDRATGTPLKTKMNSGAPGGKTMYVPLRDIRPVTVIQIK